MVTHTIADHGTTRVAGVGGGRGEREPGLGRPQATDAVAGANPQQGRRQPLRLSLLTTHARADTARAGKMGSKPSG
jgi:hypothetical protein